jgi:hypothetical protein
MNGRFGSLNTSGICEKCKNESLNENKVDFKRELLQKAIVSV